MAPTLLTSKIWNRITSAARRGKGDVAVAYLGSGAAKLLPLRAGSTLVVDASEAAVRSGQTDPRELKSLHDAEVDVFSVGNLHAKVFVFGGVAIIGSANASGRSATHLIEAALETSARPVVAQARRFVRSMAVESLGPEHLDELIKIYRPPRFPSRAATRTRRGRIHPLHAPLRIVQLKRISYGDAEKEAARVGGPIARRDLRPRFRLEEFSWGPGTPRRGELVLQVTREDDRRLMVSPPGRVLHMQPVRGSKRRIVFLEVPARNRRSISQARPRLGAVIATRLRRGGYLSSLKVAEVLSLWRMRVP
jgi:hypothetical protein